MGEATREWIRRHHHFIGVSLGLFVAVIGILIFPHHIAATVAVVSVLIAVFVAWARSPLARVKPSVAGIPGLTIGGHFKRTNAYFVRIMVPVTAAWVVVITLFLTGLSNYQRQGLAIGGAVMLSVVGALLLRNRLRCPRCGSDFRKERIAKLGRWSFDTRGTADLWDACPHCGVSFNDPWP